MKKRRVVKPLSMAGLLLLCAIMPYQMVHAEEVTPVVIDPNPEVSDSTGVNVIVPNTNLTIYGITEIKANPDSIELKPVNGSIDIFVNGKKTEISDFNTVIINTSSDKINLIASEDTLEPCSEIPFHSTKSLQVAFLDFEKRLLILKQEAQEEAWRNLPVAVPTVEPVAAPIPAPTPEPTKAPI